MAYCLEHKRIDIGPDCKDCGSIKIQIEKSPTRKLLIQVLHLHFKTDKQIESRYYTLKTLKSANDFVSDLTTEFYRKQLMDWLSVHIVIAKNKLKYGKNYKAASSGSTEPSEVR